MEIKFNDNSDAIKKALEDAIPVALESVGLQAEGYAKDACPVDTGLLRNSITFALSGGNAHTSEYQDAGRNQYGYYSGTAPESDNPCVYIGTNVEYAPYIELGTVKSAAQPFLKPAAADHKDQYKQIISETIKNQMSEFT